MADITDTLPAEEKVRFVSVDLENPIARGDTRISAITLRKPRGGELRGGITLQDLLTTDISAMLKVIPRISNPPLTQDEADALEPEDLTEICGAIRGFFITKAERAVMDAMIAEHRPKT